ncbi:MAG TPA: helix-turn-helix transcriptional regulator [Afipia sp.]
MPMRKSGPLDAMLGARIQMLRLSRGISQAALAEKIDVSFQQVQKYERGTHRVGTNRLARIASVLDVSVTEFFESSRTKPPGLKSPIHLLAEPGAWQVLKAYARTPSPRVRSCIVKLIESIADRSSGATAKVVARLRAVDLGERRKFPSRR